MRWLYAVPVLILTTFAAARDVVIPPIVDAPPAVTDSVSAPFLDLTSARELARLDVEDGTVQTLKAPLPVTVDRDTPFAASARIELEGAAAARIRFSGVAPGTILWLSGAEGEEVIRFEPTGTEVWGPTTKGPSVFIAAEGRIGGLTITAVAAVEAVTTQATSACLEDVVCPAASQAFETVLDASRAVAYIRYIRDGRAQVCTGALLSDVAQTRTPYVLTARHCIDSAETAATVEIIWDLRTSACGSNRMAAYSRTNGAELLVSSETTDMALLKLRSLPPGRVFLGVDTRALVAGTTVNRVSHASGLAQTFAGGVVNDRGPSCARAPRTSFIYSDPTAGGIATGSSGAPLLVGGLYVAGQLLGLCGADPNNPCATFNDTVDGSIRESWPLLAAYLDPSWSPARKRRAAR
jgi:hypothetical protein